MSNVQTSLEVLDWYHYGKSIGEFHQSPKFIRVLVGGRGSGKTTGVAVECVGHAWHNPGAKILLLRKTETSQDSTTIDTFNQVYAAMGNAYKQTTTSLFRSWDGGRTVRLPSQVAVEKYNAFMATDPSKTEIQNWLDAEGDRWCSWLEFRGIPDEAKRGNKLRGYECSLAVMIEADLMDRGDFELIPACLRWKNAFGEYIKDTGIIIDTNPPDPRHWIAKTEEAEMKLIAEGGVSEFQFWHISTFENEHNLPPDYIRKNILLPYRDNPAMIKRMLYGQYAEAFDGNAVFESYKVQFHETDNLPFPTGAYLVRSWDFGTNNAVIWSAYWSEGYMDEGGQTRQQEYWWDLFEYIGQGIDVDQQCREVLRLTASEFPFWNNRDVCSGILDFCDPAGVAKKDTGSSVAVLHTYGIHPGYRTKDRGIPKTIALYNRLLRAKNIRGEFIYRIDKLGCPILAAASMGGYRYPKEGESGYGVGLPKKDGFYDHPADASRYGKINCLQLLKQEVEGTAQSVGQLAAKTSVNPPRRY